MGKRRKISRFGELDQEGFLYRINPFTQAIEGMKIKDIYGVQELLQGNHPTPEMYKHFVKIICYMPETITHSPDLSNIPTIAFILDGREAIQLTLQTALVPGTTHTDGEKETYPIPMGCNRDVLLKWQKR